MGDPVCGTPSFQNGTNTCYLFCWLKFAQANDTATMTEHQIRDNARSFKKRAEVSSC